MQAVAVGAEPLAKVSMQCPLIQPQTLLVHHCAHKLYSCSEVNPSEPRALYLPPFSTVNASPSCSHLHHEAARPQHGGRGSHVLLRNHNVQVSSQLCNHLRLRLLLLRQAAPQPRASRRCLAAATERRGRCAGTAAAAAALTLCRWGLGV